MRTPNCAAALHWWCRQQSEQRNTAHRAADAGHVNGGARAVAHAARVNDAAGAARALAVERRRRTGAAHALADDAARAAAPRGVDDAGGARVCAHVAHGARPARQTCACAISALAAAAAPLVLRDVLAEGAAGAREGGCGALRGAERGHARRGHRGAVAKPARTQHAHDRISRAHCKLHSTLHAMKTSCVRGRCAALAALGCPWQPDTSTCRCVV
jgi:hypothetical protein